MFPNKIQVGGIGYAVQTVPFVEIDQNRNYQGACRPRLAVIEVLNDLAEDRQKQVLAHELIHAMMFEAGINDHDEDMVERLGIVFHQVLKDNDFTFMRS